LFFIQNILDLILNFVSRLNQRIVFLNWWNQWDWTVCRKRCRRLEWNAVLKVYWRIWVI